MPDGSTLLLFAAAALALIVVPGPAVLYIVAQGIDRGRLAGVVSALGISAGGLVHVTAAAVGLSALIVSSATAFTVVKYAGAAYLIVLGLRRLLAHDDGPRRPPSSRSARCAESSGRARSSTCSTRRRRCSFSPSCPSSSTRMPATSRCR